MDMHTQLRPFVHTLCTLPSSDQTRNQLLCNASIRRGAVRLNLVLHLRYAGYVMVTDDVLNLTCALLHFRPFVCSQGNEHIRVSRFYKEGTEGKFVTFFDEDTRTLYDGFRRGAKESSKSLF